MAYAMDPNHDRFVVYQHRHMHRRGRSELIIPNDERVITSNSITLQLNDKHPSFRNHQFRLKNVFLNAKQVCIDGLTQFAKYNVFVCNHEQCPYPVIDWDMVMDVQIPQFEYRRKFTIQQFVRDVLLRMNSEPLNPETTYVVVSYESYAWASYAMSDILENHDGGHGQMDRNIYVFKMQTMSTDANKKKIEIRFVQDAEQLNTKTKLNEFENINYCGFPLIAWVAKKDTFQNIIDKYLLPKVIHDINCVYRVIRNQIVFKIESIARSQWNQSLWILNKIL
eukprot:234272_1